MNSVGPDRLKVISIAKRGVRSHAAALMLVVLYSVSSFFSASPSLAFPLWPKSKEKAAPVENGPAHPAAKSTKANDPGLPAAGQNGSTSDLHGSAKSGEAVQNVPVQFVPSARDAIINAATGSGDIGNLNLSVEGARAVASSSDPMAIYRAAGVSLVEERKIRQLAQEFESMQRVRLKLLSNLLEEMRQFELQTEPDAKTVLAKQDEINKLSDLMATDRTKLILDIRDAMSHAEKQNLVETLQKAR